MQSTTSIINLIQQRRAQTSALPFAVSFLSFCLLSALLIGWKPLQLSIATIFLFAGPHNWIEFRYFLARMPRYWGKSKTFFTVALSGVFLLTVFYVALCWLGQSWYLNEDAWATSISFWNSALLIWICSLVWLRGKQSLKRDWSWVFAIGFALAAFAWVAPLWFSIALVYVHPLVALWFLDRQLKRTKPQWRSAYHVCLAALPLILIVMWTLLANSPNLPDADLLSWRIAQHAGAGIITNISTHLLVATHVFLETIHYGVWIILIPLVGFRAGIFETKKIPFAVHREGFPKTVMAVLALGVLIVFALWICFYANYTTTRDVYFTFAMAHVLAEIPFLIRLI
jgi:hypothetical protein